MTPLHDIIRMDLTVRCTLRRRASDVEVPLNYEQFVLDYGVALTGSPLPPRIRHGIPRACFHNAMLLMQRQRGRYVYMEGFAVAPNFPIVTHHGWVWDLERGHVIDPTWSQIEDLNLSETAYLGVPFRSTIVDRGAILNESACLFYDWAGKRPGWVLQLQPDEFYHPLTSPYPHGGGHGPSVSTLVPQRRTARAARTIRARAASPSRPR